MVGIAGTVGDVGRDPSVLTEELSLFGDEVAVEHDDGDAFVTAVSHSVGSESRPARVGSTGELLWVWGNAYGYLGSDGGYTSRRQSGCSTAEYCAGLYEAHGRPFLAGLNGSFVGVIYDEDSGTVEFFTDRLGSRPIHYAVTDEGVAFATGLQALCRLLEGRLSFDEQYLTEYFSFERALGRKTPVEGIERAHPGAITRVDPADGSVAVDVEWQPVHRPVDWSFDEFTDRFADIFDSAVSERYDPDRETGVLLSGGSDSRLILGALPDRGVRGFHVNDWQNREARIAERVADVAGKPFTFVERDGDYYGRALAFSQRVSNYTSWFQHGHAAAAVDTLRENCDLLMTGHYSDTLFKNNYLPYRGVIVPGTTIELPLYLRRDVRSTEDLVDLYMGTKFHNRKHLRAPPDYVRTGDLRSVLAANITRSGDGVNHHGVRHATPSDAGLFSECYPLTNTAGRLFFDVMLQTAPFRDPFLDMRLVELMTLLPVRYRLRRNLINAAVGRIQPELGEIPHPETNVALARPFPVQYLALYVNWLGDKLTDDATPESFYTQGSWPDWDDLVRERDIVGSVLDEHAALLESIEWIDADRLRSDYDRHMAGEDRFDELSAAVSFLSIPATGSLVHGIRSDDRARPSPGE